MKLVKPYIDENRQVIFVELEHETAHDVVNGVLLAVLVFVPLALITPKPI